MCPRPKYNIDADWFSQPTATPVTRYLKIEGYTAERKNTLFASWTSDRCVLMETYEDVVGGKYTFMGEETGLNGFSQGTPLSADAVPARA